MDPVTRVLGRVLDLPEAVLVFVGLGAVAYLLIWFPRAIFATLGGAVLGVIVTAVLMALTGYDQSDVLLIAAVVGGAFGIVLLR